MDKPAEHLTREIQSRVRVLRGAIFTRHNSKVRVHTVQRFEHVLRYWHVQSQHLKIERGLLLYMV